MAVVLSSTVFSESKLSFFHLQPQPRMASKRVKSSLRSGLEQEVSKTPRSLAALVIRGSAGSPRGSPFAQQYGLNTLSATTPMALA
eukprot:3077557-Amphidinium_carterae.1